MPIDIPTLDPADEDRRVAESIDAMPAEVIQSLPPIFDRSPSAYWPRFIHASIKPFYAALTLILRDIPVKIHLWLLNRLGIEPLPSVPAVVTVEFLAATSAGATVPAGTVVKNATGLDAHKFVTDTTIEPADFVAKMASTTATAVVPGAAPNQLGAGTLTLLESPIPGIDSVTNPAPPTDGEDIEPWDTFLERVPRVMRATRGPDGELMAITREDFELITQMVPGVARAKALRCTYYNKSDLNKPPGPVHQLGAVAMILVDHQINSAPNPTTSANVIQRLTDATVPGVTVTVHHPAIRRVYVQKVEVVLQWPYTTTSVKPAIKTRLSKHLTAIDRINENGKSIDHRGWKWGKSLHYNDLIALLDGVTGVERVGQIWVQTSDDSGSTWSPPALLTEVMPGADATDNTDFGLLHWGEDINNPFQVISIAA